MENVACFMRRELMATQWDPSIIGKRLGYKSDCDMTRQMRAGTLGVPVDVAEGGHLDEALAMGTIQALIGTKPI